MKRSIATIAARCNRLTSLDLGYCGLSDSVLKRVVGATPKLLLLSVEGCVNLTDAGMEAVALCSEMEFLNFDGCSQITDSGVAKIARRSTINY
jgi:hypothetical protein